MRSGGPVSTRSAGLVLLSVVLLSGLLVGMTGSAAAASDTVTLHDSAQGTEITSEDVQDGETVYVKITDGTTTTGGTNTVSVSSTNGGSITVTVYDDGTGDDNSGTDGNYWGNFTVTSGSTDDSTDTLSVDDTNDATATGDLDGDTNSGSAVVTADYTAPSVSGTPEVTSTNKVTVTFGEGVYSGSDGTGPLTDGQFTYTDSSGDGASGINSVSHSAGSNTATLTLNTDIKNSDLGSDTINIAADAIYDQAGNGIASSSTNYADSNGDDVNPTITSDISATESGGDVSITFSADEQLSTIDVGIDSTTLTSTDFSESGSGPYTYTATYTPGSDGSYTATLNTVGDGTNSISPGSSDSATVDTTGPSFGSVTSPSEDPTSNNQPTVSVDSVSDALNNVDPSTIQVQLVDSADNTDVSYTDAGTTSGLSFSSNTVSLDLSTTGDTLTDDTYDVVISADDDDDSPNSNSNTFSSAFEVDTNPPTVSGTPEVTSTNKVTVTFSEGVYSGSGGTGALSDTQFSYTDNNGGNGATSIQSVSHSAGSSTAELTLNTDVRNSDLGSDTIDISADAIYDQAGNGISSSSPTYADATPDDVNPTITSDISATESGSDVSITFSADEQLSTIDVGINGDTLTSTDFSESGGGPYTYTATYTPSSDGSYTATLNTVGDGTNSITPGTTDSATVDTTGPSFGSVTSPSDPTSNNQPTVSVDSVSDALNNVDPSTIQVQLVDIATNTDVSYTGTGTNGLSFSSGTVSLDLSTTGDTLTDDTYDVVIAADDDDDSPNSNSTTFSSAFKVDTTAPTVSGTPEVTSTNKVTVTFSEGVYSGSDGTGALSSGQFTYTDSSGDGASGINSVSHSAGSNTATLTLDTDIKNSDLSSDTIDIAADAIYDQAGNGISSSSPTYADATPDDVKPTITSDISATESGGDVSITFSADEQLSTIDVGIDGDTLTSTDFSESGGGPYTYTTTYTPGSDGTYTATLNTVGDGTNSISPGSSDSATVDTTGPSFGSVTSPSDPTSNNQPTVSVDSVSDDLNSVDPSTIQVQLVDSAANTDVSYTGTGTNGLSFSSGTVSLDLSTTGDTLTDDTYDVVIAADDDDDSPNSNSNTFSSAFGVDTTAPSVTNVQLSDFEDGNGIVADGDRINISAEVTDANGIASVSADASAFGAGSVTLSQLSGDTYNTTATVDEASATEGDQSVTVNATDALGNGGSQNIGSGTLTVDTNGPIVSIISLTDNTDGNSAVNASDEIKISADVTDSVSGVNTVTADASAFDAGTVTLTLESGSTYTNTTSVGSNPTEGAQSVSVSATDNAGNSGPAATSGTITVDTTAPTISSFTITNNDPTNADDIEVFIDSSEPLVGIDVNITGAESGALSKSDFTVSSDTYTANYTASTDGDYTATLEKAADAAGNDGSSGQSDTVTRDTDFPSITNVSLGNDGSDNLNLSFDSDTELGDSAGDVAVSVDGPNNNNVYTFDRTNFTESPSGGIYTYDLSATQTYDDGDGTYEVSIDDAIDPADNNGGNNGGGSGLNDTYRFDTTAPSLINITDPQNSDRITSQNTIEGSAIDNVAVADVNLTIRRDSDGYYWNGTAWQASQTNVSASADSGSFTAAREPWSYDSSSITADGDYNVTANATDIRGNTNQSAVVNFTLYTPSPPSNDGGGGGGGGGASLSTTPAPPAPEGTTVVSEATSTSRRVSGGTTTVGFEEQSPVESISFDSTNVDGGATVQELSSTPETAGDPPGRTVTVNRISVPDDARDTSATIRTRVSADRLAEVDATADQLQINRYNEADEEWQSLDTSVADETETGVVLEARTPGFSIFTVSTVDEETEPADEPEQPADDTEPTTNDTDTEDTSDEGLPGFGVPVALAALVTMALLARRKLS